MAHPPALLQTLGVVGTYVIPVAQPPSGGKRLASTGPGGPGPRSEVSTRPKTDSGFRCRHWMSTLTPSHGLATNPLDTKASHAPAKPYFQHQKMCGKSPKGQGRVEQNLSLP